MKMNNSNVTALEVISGRDLHGLNAIVTGGAAGIGYETVRALAAAGANVTIADCDLERAESIIEVLRKETNNNSIEIAYLDLASLDSVNDFCKNFLAKEKPLHILINNAGIFAPPNTQTADEFGLQFEINYLGHFALTNWLLPALKAAGKARVVSLTSLGHRLSDMHFDDLFFRNRQFELILAYAESKTAMALLGVALTKRYLDFGITANAVHPGVVKTNIFKNMPREEQIRRGLIDEFGNCNPLFITPEQGAATVIWAAVAPELDGIGGKYLENCTIAEPMKEIELPPGQFLRGYKPYCLEPINADHLWLISEELVNKKLTSWQNKIKE